MIEHGVWAGGGPGKDYLILAGSLDDWDIQTSPDLDGFDIRPWAEDLVPMLWHVMLKLSKEMIYLDVRDRFQYGNA